MLLPSLISTRRPVDDSLELEDIFRSSIGSIFTDDLQNFHGDDSPGTVIVYKSRIHGELKFRTAVVDGEEQRGKFAHHLWNSGVLMAELIGGRGDSGVVLREGEQQHHGEQKGDWWWIGGDEEKFWAVKNETVLELGAGW
jgi:hypothetical protein